MKPVSSLADHRQQRRWASAYRTFCPGLLTLLILLLATAARAQTVVQSNSGFGTGTTNPAVSFHGNNTAGNLLWVAVGSTGTITAPTDTLGNIYTLAASVTGLGGSGNAAIYYVASAKAGANTVTCNHSTSGDIHCQIAEISGLATTSQLDKTGSVASSSTCSVKTSAATTQANEWVAAFLYDGSNSRTLTAGTGYGTLQLSSDIFGPGTAISESKNVTSTGTQTATCSGNSTDLLSQLITTFKARTVSGPSITSLSPTVGAVGATVTIHGANFGSTQGTSTVTFNGTPATPTSWSASSIAVPVPGGATTGNVVVTVGGNASNGMNFTVAPVISSLIPASGAVGSSVEITGSNFGATKGSSTVTVSGLTPTIKSWTSTRIVIVIPTGATTGNVVVTVGGQASNSVAFTVVPVPNITSLSPTSGVAGTPVTITGTNFGATQGTGDITFGGVPCRCSPAWSNTSIQATVPPGARTGNVVVTAAGGDSSNGVPFSVPPWIGQLSPIAGPVGSSLTITGTEFGSTQGTSTVNLGGASLTPTSWSDTSIVVSIPSGAVSGDVVVTVGGLASSGVVFSVVPTITSLSPTSGGAGSTVTITGTGFAVAQATSTVTFNGTAATTTNWSNTSISALVPNGATTGNVAVNVAGNASNGVSFTPTLGIGSESPNAAPVGTPITISGTAFGSTQGTSTVTFNGTTAAVTSWSNGTIVAAVPSGATTGNIVVKVGGTSSNGMGFTVTPAISSLSPASGAAGTAVTITGTNFGATQGASTVTFNNAAATPTTWSNTSISVPVPTGATTGNVVVTVGGNASNGVNFTPTLGIGNESPSSGPVGTLVTISGTGFGSSQNTSTVTFNGTPATPTSWSSGSIVVPVPSGATTGNLVVTVGGIQSNSAPFTVTPGLSSLFPASGAAGTSVTITGTNFGSTQGSSTVSFNGTASTPTAWSNTSISVPVPNGATTGNVVVTVSGNASNGINFTTVLSISSESPTSGSVGTTVTISGTGFGNTQGTSTVTFNGTASTPTSWGNGSIVVPVPSGATSGNIVVTVGGISSRGVGFTVTPGISSLSPSSGPAGTAVTITGTSFGAAQGTSTVTFNGVAATPTVWGNTSISVPVPNGATTGNVVVTVSSNASNGVNFTPTLGTSSASPTSGPVGTAVTISGTGFGSNQGSSTVTFNGTSATPLSWTSGGIVVQVPNGATTGNLVVTVGGTASNARTFTVTNNPVVQSNSGFGGGVTSTSVPFLSNNTAGNLLWVAVGAGGTITPPTDTQGNTYTLATSAIGTGGSGNGAIYYAASAKAGPNTVTCNQSAADDIHCHIVEVTGFASSSPLDQTGSVASSSTCSVSTSAATAQPNEWVGAFFYDASGDPPLTAGTGFTAVQLSNNSSGDGAFSENGTASSAGVQTASCAGNSSAALTQLITTFQTTAGVAVPVISSLSPSSGPVGSSVVIAGSNFGPIQGTNKVTFNGITASVTSWSASSITAVVPAGASTGNVVVTVAGVPSGGVGFTVVPPPSISTITPNSGAVGSSVVIAGSNFGATQGGGMVSFNGTTATVSSWSASSITVAVPAEATSGNVVVTMAGGVSSAGVSFTVAPTPVITSLTPNTGATLSSVTIAGANFGTVQGNGGVTFNGTPVTLLQWSNTSIAVQVPAAATTGPVVVTASGGVSSAGVSFTVLPAPVITSLSPIAGAVGSQVTINGNNFGSSQSTSTVAFNGVFAAARGRVAVSWNNTQIVVNVPSGATTGNVVVTVGGKASNAVPFGINTYITALSPAFGPVGTLVSVNGSGFGQTQGTSTVTFNGTTATPQNWSDSSIVVSVPSGVTTGNVVVTVGGVASNGVVFTAAPVITSLSASTLAVGASLTITGQNFGATQGSGTVTFNGTAGEPTSWSSTQIVVPVPIGATPGNVVVTANGMASNGVNFTPGPFVSALSQSTAAVGAPITITGGNFGASQGTSTVTFNGTAGVATSWSNTQIVVPVPLGATPGNLVVTVSGLASNPVNFAPGPSLSSVSPVTAAPGTTVTINGVNFGGAQGTSVVSFNGAAATSITQWNNTQIQAVVPNTASTGNVVVTVGGEASNGLAFTVLPTITNLSPASGFVGTAITIKGGGFGATQGTSTVTFNGTTAVPVSWSTTQIVAQVPNAAISGNVVVTVNGNPSNGANFTVTPRISSLLPPSGAVGTVVTINGTSFGASQGTSTVTLNGTTATPSLWTSTQIVFTVPTGATTGNVVVTVGGSASNAVPFTVAQGQAGTASVLTSFVATDGSLHTFYVGPDQHVYHLFWNSTNNWQFQDLTQITGSTAAGSGTALTSFFKTAGPSYQVAYVDGNSHVNEMVWSSGIWSSQDLTSASASSVAAASNTQLTSLTDSTGDHIYYLGANQHEYQLYWNGFEWVNQDLTTLSGTAVLAASGSALSSFSLSDGSEHLFYVGSNQHVYQMLAIPVIGDFNQDLTYTAAVNFAAGPCAQQNGTCTVSSATTVGFGANGSWNFLTVNSNVACNVATFGDPAPGVTKACYYVNTTFPLAIPGSALTSFNDSNGDHVYYLDSSGHNHELQLKGDPGSVTAPWTDQDQTKNSGTTVVAVAGSALASFGTSDKNRHLIYLDTNHHVDQMLYEANNTVWVNQDLTTSAGASVTAAAGSGLTGLVPASGNLEDIQYLDSNGHINQLGLSSSNVWQNQDLTAIATNAGGTPPGISSLSPTSGVVGTAITINGNNFGASQGTSTVTFNGTPAGVTSWSNTQIVALVPSGATTGNVVVTVAEENSNGVSFAVSPGISNLFPTSGPVGTAVTITGNNFGSTQDSSTITFNGIPATPTSWSTTQIIVPVPGGATTGNVVVTVGGVAGNVGSFAVVPTILSLSPNSGLIGTQVTITGTGFGSSQGSSTVSFNGVPATPTAWSNTQITASVPTGAITGNVVVAVKGLASNGLPFTVTNPYITSLSPPAGLAGSSVTINGANFGSSQSSSTVSFGGQAVTPTSWSANAIGIIVPGNATLGNNSVSVTVGGLTSNTATHVVTNTTPPAITSVTPNSGQVGTVVVIAGSNFGDTQVGGGSFVTFNGAFATVTTWSKGSITAIVPNTATSGPVVVSVAGAPSAGVPFTVISPTITGIQPVAEAVGASITINGSGFGQQRGQSTVTFGNTAAAVTSWGSNQIVVTVPASVSAGATNLVVTVPGQPPAQQQFTVLPGVTGLALHAGPPKVGFQITGTNFGNQQPAGSAVMLGGVQLTPLPNTWTNTSVVVQIPNNTPPTSGSIVITVNGRAAQGSNNNFSVAAQPLCTLP